MADLKNTLRGTGVAIVTPFTDDNAVDYDALAALLDNVIINGVNYIVSLGTTGETPTLSLDEKIAIINFTVDKIDGRVPLVVGAGSNNTAALIEEVNKLPLQYACAILSASPYYNKPSQEGIYQHYKALAEASPVPVILYNVPGRTSKAIEVSTTLRLAADCENIAGTKEAANSIGNCVTLVRDCRKDFLILSGDDDLVMAQLACGIDGVISVAANCFPSVFSSMIQAGLQADFNKARVLNDSMVEAYGLLFAENNPAGVKSFLAHQFMIKNNLRLPLVPLSKGYDEQVKAFLSRSNF